MRTKCIKTIEKLINALSLADKIGNNQEFNNATKYALENQFQKWWNSALNDPDLSRLLFYKNIKTFFGMEGYLKIQNFQQRRHITKLRCSDHALEIEKGRHRKTLRQERICTICGNGEVEDEEHFLLKCHVYNSLKLKYNFDHINEAQVFFTENNLLTLGKYLKEAFDAREGKIRGNSET